MSDAATEMPRLSAGEIGGGTIYLWAETPDGDPQGACAGTIETGDLDARTAEAYAREIVVRVNAHDALIGSVGHFLAVWDAWMVDASSVNPMDAVRDSDIEDLRAALAAAAPQPEAAR